MPLGEAARVRVVRMLRPVVPLAKRPGRIARLSERLGDRVLVDVQALLAGRDAPHAAAGAVAARQELGRRRCADGADIEARENRAAVGERVDVAG